MVTQKKETKKLYTPVFRVGFPFVFEPRETENGDKYEVVMLFPKSADLTALKKAASEAAREKWGEKIPSNLHSPFRDGAEKADIDGFGPDVIFVRAWSKNAPGIVDRDGKTPITSPQEFYGGCFARATVSAFAYDRKEKKGVTFMLQNLQKVKDGDAFSGRTHAEDDFEAIADDYEGAAAPPAAAGDSLFE